LQQYLQATITIIKISPAGITTKATIAPVESAACGGQGGVLAVPYPHVYGAPTLFPLKIGFEF
jgi:hypothetical protein